MSVLEDYKKLSKPLRRQLAKIVDLADRKESFSKCYTSLCSQALTSENLPDTVNRQNGGSKKVVMFKQNKSKSTHTPRDVNDPTDKASKPGETVTGKPGETGNGFTGKPGHREASLKRKMLRYAVYKENNVHNLLQSSLIRYMNCYSPDDVTVSLNRVIKSSQHAVVLEGKLSNRDVIVKWYQSKKRDCTYEAEIYQRMKDAGANTPWFSSKFMFWDKPVLVIERLQPLDHYDNPQKLGIHILKQLKFLHKFAVHCDIKPGNIMKRVSYDNGKMFTSYILIDYGGVSTEKLEHGYRRWIWSPKYTSQPSHQRDQIATAVNDFVELGYTLRILQNWKKNHGKNEGDFKKGYRGRMSKYVERVEKVNPKEVKDTDYDDLIAILKAK